MNRLLCALFLTLSLGLPSASLASPRVDTSAVPQFPTEAAAQVSGTAANARAGLHGPCLPAQQDAEPGR